MHKSKDKLQIYGKKNQVSQRDRFSVALYATEERSPELWSNNEANWMVSNSAKLDRRTKQHTQFGVSASNGSRDMARTKSWGKKRKKKK